MLKQDYMDNEKTALIRNSKNPLYKVVHYCAGSNGSKASVHYRDVRY